MAFTSGVVRKNGVNQRPRQALALFAAEWFFKAEINAGIYFALINAGWLDFF